MTGRLLRILLRIPTRIGSLECALFFGVLALAAPLQGQPASAEAPFFHFAREGEKCAHVPSDWLRAKSEEMPRDCRGCHYFPKNAAPGTKAQQPSAVCANCHYGNSMAVRETEGLQLHADEWPFAGLQWRKSFAHVKHLDLDCARCHRGAVGNFGFAAGSDGMSTPIGPGICIECHDPKDANFAQQDRSVAGFRKILDGCDSMASMKSSGFRHDEHLNATEIAEATGCATCHHTILETFDPRWLRQSFDPASCNACHVRADGSSAPFFAMTPWSSIADNTFRHSDHAKSSCKDCHPFHADQGTFSTVTAPPDPTRTLTPLFLTCYTGVCHADLVIDKAQYIHGAATTTAGTALLCRSCHVDAPAGQRLTADLMRERRPLEDIKRSELDREFGLKNNQHPGLTATVDAKCAECHKANLSALASRIGSRPFDHLVHLGTTLAAADCRSCHEEVARSPGAAAFATVFSESACQECHIDPHRPVIQEERLVDRQVLRFPHDRHLDIEYSEGGVTKVLGCLLCHEPPAEGVSTNFSVPSEKICSQCHDHDAPENMKRSGELGLQSVKGCVHCHGFGMPSTAEAAPTKSIVSIKEITGIAPGASQRHPDPATIDCRQCHKVAPLRLEPQLIDHVFGRKLSSAHADGTTPRKSNMLQNCLDCHWADPPRSARGVAELDGHPYKTWRDLFGKRGDFGSDLQDYPGGRRR